MDTETTHTADVERTLAEAGFAHNAEPWRRWLKWAALAVLALAVAYWVFGRGGERAPRYVTQEVVTGDLTVTVTATGNLEPRNQVDIGSELSGTIREVFVDVNDEVTEGQVLAELDTTRLEAQVLQAQSSLASAEARVIQSEASRKEAQANLARLHKVRELSGGKLPSQQDMDVAEAAVARAEGDVAAARAAVAQSRATLEAVRTDLSKAKIRSPINGIVLVRAVEPGQTVAASLQVATLFTLAEDLKKMELHVSVDEADVGSVAVGQKGAFTVDAYPNRTFSAHITQVHFASSNTAKAAASGASQASATSTGVVTYETVLEVDNSDLLLRPGMTATAEIVTTNIENAVLIPNAALRFTPEGVELPGASTASQQRSPLSALMPQIRRRGFGGQQNGASRRFGRAWILEDGEPAMVMFRTGSTDGRMTQVLSSEGAPPALPGPLANNEQFRKALERKVEPGAEVIVDAQATKS